MNVSSLSIMIFVIILNLKLAKAMGLNLWIQLEDTQMQVPRTYGSNPLHIFKELEMWKNGRHSCEKKVNPRSTIFSKKHGAWLIPKRDHLNFVFNYTIRYDLSCDINQQDKIKNRLLIFLNKIEFEIYKNHNQT